MKVKYRIISYDDYINPTLKIESDIELDNDMPFDKAIEYIVGLYNKDYLNKQIYVKDLCEMTWCKYFDMDFIFRRMGYDSYHYKWLKSSLRDVDISFDLFSNTLEIIIDGPGIGGIVDRIEGMDFIIHTNEKDKHMNNPHVHVKYGGEELFIYIKDGSIKDNKSFKNKKKTKIAINYVKSNKRELLKAWNKITDSDLNIDIYF